MRASKAEGSIQSIEANLQELLAQTPHGTAILALTEARHAAQDTASYYPNLLDALVQKLLHPVISAGGSLAAQSRDAHTAHAATLAKLTEVMIANAERRTFWDKLVEFLENYPQIPLALCAALAGPLLAKADKSVQDTVAGLLTAAGAALAQNQVTQEEAPPTKAQGEQHGQG